MNPEDIRWDYLSQFDWMIFVGCIIAVWVLVIALAVIRAKDQTIVRLMDALDELREDDVEFLSYPKSLVEDSKPLDLKRVGKTESTHLYFDGEDE